MYISHKVSNNNSIKQISTKEYNNKEINIMRMISDNRNMRQCQYYDQTLYEIANNKLDLLISNYHDSSTNKSENIGVNSSFVNDLNRFQEGQRNLKSFCDTHMNTSLFSDDDEDDDDDDDDDSFRIFQINNTVVYQYPIQTIDNLGSLYTYKTIYIHDLLYQSIINSTNILLVVDKSHVKAVKVKGAELCRYLLKDNREAVQDIWRERLHPDQYNSSNIFQGLLEMIFNSKS
jgi:hypothetical protein